MMAPSVVSTLSPARRFVERRRLMRLFSCGRSMRSMRSSRVCRPLASRERWPALLRRMYSSVLAMNSCCSWYSRIWRSRRASRWSR